MIDEITTKYDVSFFIYNCFDTTPKTYNQQNLGEPKKTTINGIQKQYNFYVNLFKNNCEIPSSFSSFSFCLSSIPNNTFFYTIEKQTSYILDWWPVRKPPNKTKLKKYTTAKWSLAPTRVDGSERENLHSTLRRWKFLRHSWATLRLLASWWKADNRIRIFWFLINSRALDWWTTSKSKFELAQTCRKRPQK